MIRENDEMTRKNDSSPARAGPPGPRRAWHAPRIRRLATSAAEFGALTHVDAEGMS